jgi:hypothetical protein
MDVHPARHAALLVIADPERWLSRPAPDGTTLEIRLEPEEDALWRDLGLAGAMFRATLEQRARELFVERRDLAMVRFLSAAAGRLAVGSVRRSEAASVTWSDVAAGHAQRLIEEVDRWEPSGGRLDILLHAAEASLWLRRDAAGEVFRRMVDGYIVEVIGAAAELESLSLLAEVPPEAGEEGPGLLELAVYDRVSAPRSEVGRGRAATVDPELSVS